MYKLTNGECHPVTLFQAKNFENFCYLLLFLIMYFLFWLQDLIHGAPIGKPASNKAVVSAVYIDSESHKETKFTRIIHGSSSDHKVNGKVWQLQFTCLL